MKFPTTRILLLSLAAACASGKDAIDITKPVTGAEASNAAIAYNKAMEEKKSQNFIEATRFFEWVRNNFPYSQYAALSELALADMSFERDDYGAAATAYQDFVKSHPSHPKADYAAFRVGLSYYLDKPSDWFLLPPSSEKDQTPIIRALDALNRFVLNYPKSDLVHKAKDMINECRERLAAHERYVAEFYWKREAWRGAAGRLLSLADTYGDLQDGKIRGDSLWRASVAYRNAKSPADERAVLQRLLQESPRDPHRREAEARLAQIPAPAPRPTPPQEPRHPEAQKPQPITPTETPSAPGERPQSTSGPGVPAGASESQRPIAPPEGAIPAGPTNQLPKPPAPPPNPSTQPPTPPLAPPDK